MLFIIYPKCSTCINAKKWLDDNKVSYNLRDIKLDNPTYEELLDWSKFISIDKLFNKSGLVYKALGLKDKIQDMTLKEKCKILSTDGMLVKRPLIIDKNMVIAGFKPLEWQEYFYNNAK